MGEFVIRKPCYFSAEDVEAHAFYLKCDKYSMSISVGKHELWFYKEINGRYHVSKDKYIQLNFPNEKEFRKWFTPIELQGLNTEAIVIDEKLPNWMPEYLGKPWSIDEDSNSKCGL